MLTRPAFALFTKNLKKLFLAFLDAISFLDWMFVGYSHLSYLSIHNHCKILMNLSDFCSCLLTLEQMLTFLDLGKLAKLIHLFKFTLFHLI